MRRFLLLVFSVVIAAPGVAAHHSIAGVYDSGNPATVEGVVVDFQFINPHPFLIVEASGNGRLQQWRLEMDNRFELVAVGMTASTFKKGDRIVVTGSLARDRSPALYIRRLERADDGYWYEQVGNSPRIGRRSP
jgi:hypothetical protein